MNLLTVPLREKLIANFRETEANYGESDHWPVVRFFTPDAAATWLITEFNPEEQLFFGLCDFGLGFPELGDVALGDLLAVRGQLGLPVERDRHWTAKGPISAYLNAAFAAGHIVEIGKAGE